MDARLQQVYTKLINKHFSAVQTDANLGHSDSWSLEEKAKQYWADFHSTETEFKALLERCTIND